VGRKQKLLKTIFHFSFVIRRNALLLETGEQALQQMRRRLETRRLESGLVCLVRRGTSALSKRRAGKSGPMKNEK
jgi:hypothetical protein